MLNDNTAVPTAAKPVEIPPQLVKRGSAAPNQHSTTEWVDEPYAINLWKQLLTRRTPSRASLLTVRVGALVGSFRARGRLYWVAELPAPGPDGSLDVIFAYYDGAGHFLVELTALRITRHAGQRLFERLRTNSVTDVIHTIVLALRELQNNRELWDHPVQGKEATLTLPWGRLPLIAAEGMWIAKTFVAHKHGRASH